MRKNSTTPLSFFVKNANDSRIYEHLYLRGNFKNDMFYDKVDLINAWNRMWLSARATGVFILSVVILNNHFHLTVMIKDSEQLTRFKRHLRLSLTQYHNLRYKVHGTLGTRTLKNAVLKDADDIKDCICYHARNVLHHGLKSEYMDYQFSTIRFIFGLINDNQRGIFNCDTLPGNLERAYLPAREQLPKEWWMTQEGMIIPPNSIFPKDLLESLFDNSSKTYLERLSQRTSREEANCDEEEFVKHANHSRSYNPDERVAELVKKNCQIPIPSMTDIQKMEVIRMVIKQYPTINYSIISRLFGIPLTTLIYRLKNS